MAETDVTRDTDVGDDGDVQATQVVPPVVPPGEAMLRIDALRAIYDAIKACPVVTIMGAVAAELYSLGHQPHFFYLEHAMGLASSTGLGIALCLPERRVVVLDGDGSLLMNLGTLST